MVGVFYQFQFDVRPKNKTLVTVIPRKNYRISPMHITGPGAYILTYISTVLMVMV